MTELHAKPSKPSKPPKQPIWHSPAWITAIVGVVSAFLTVPEIVGNYLNKQQDIEAAVIANRGALQDQEFRVIKETLSKQDEERVFVLRYLAATHEDEDAMAWAKEEVNRLDKLAGKEREITKLKNVQQELQLQIASLDITQQNDPAVKTELIKAQSDIQSTLTEVTKLRQEAGLPPLPAPPLAPIIFLRSALSYDLSLGNIAMFETPNSITLRMSSDGLFSSVGAEILPTATALVDRIGDALKDIPGKIVVRGHSDNTPIKSPEFPSIWSLSNARAIAVMNKLNPQIPADRISAEGASDAEPLASNAEASGRKLNRRIEIILLPIIVK